MYIAADVIEMGEAHELVLNEVKEELVFDDTAPQTMPALEYFDE